MSQLCHWSTFFFFSIYFIYIYIFVWRISVRRVCLRLQNSHALFFFFFYELSNLLEQWASWNTQAVYQLALNYYTLDNESIKSTKDMTWMFPNAIIQANKDLNKDCFIM